MMAVMPIFLVLISWNLPSGVLLYWFVSNLFYIMQQYILNKQIRESRALSSKPEIIVKAEPADPLRNSSSTVSMAKKGGKKSAKKR